MSALTAIESDLDAGKAVVIDGATGTELERRGAAMHGDTWCAMATQTSPDIVRAVHEDYVRAGARVIIANTFSSSRNMLEPAGLGEHFEPLNRNALSLALEARERCAAADRVVVAGSMSHQVPIGRGTNQRLPDAVPTTAVAAQRARDHAELLADAGAELLVLEMMSDPDLANPTIEAALATGLPVWVGFSVRADDSGQPRSSSRPDVTVDALFADVPLDGVRIAGIMHSYADLTTAALARLRERWTGPLMAYPDSGGFKMPHWQFEEIMPPLEFATHCQHWRASGVQVLGGCCGLGVEHIEALSAALG